MRRPIAAVVALLLLGVAACGGEPPASPQGPATQSPAEASASPSEPPASGSASVAPTDDPAQGEWTRTLTFGDGTTQVIGDRIAFGAAGFLALGSRWEGGEGGPRRVAERAWRSTDGREWQEVSHPSAGGDVFIHLLTTSDAGDFVIYADRPSATPGETLHLALRSSDGETWDEFESGLPDGIFVQAVERGPEGYLLVGGQTSFTNPTLWLSDDGLGWEQVFEFDQTDAFVQLDDADGGDEGYVVLGRRIAVEGGYQRFALASADGSEWVVSQQPFGPDNQEFVFATTITSVGPDWIATLGHPDEAPTAVWRSTDGLAWTELGTLDAQPITSAGVLEDTGVGLVFALSGAGPFEGVPGMWSSSDGTEWRQEVLGAEAWINDLAEGEDTVAVIGAAPGLADATSTLGIWISPID